MSLHSAAYLKHLSSFDWYLKARAAKARAGDACERCGTKTQTLDVHHLTYERLGCERDEDLLVVCRPCHEKEDALRRRKKADRMWGRRLDGWATKRYGEDWDYYHAPEEVEEAFEEWLGDRDDDY